MKRFSLLLISAIMLLCVLTSCGQPDENESSQTSTTAETTTEEITFYKSDVDTFKIETPYATLKYPSKWQDKCVVEKTDGNPYLVTIYGKADENVKLFDVAFGDVPDNAYVLGTFISNNEEITVSLIDYSSEYSENYSVENCPDFYAMSEDVNEIISGLVYDYNMTIN